MRLNCNSYNSCCFDNQEYILTGIRLQIRSYLIKYSLMHKMDNLGKTINLNCSMMLNCNSYNSSCQPNQECILSRIQLLISSHCLKRRHLNTLGNLRKIQNSNRKAEIQCKINNSNCEDSQCCNLVSIHILLRSYF